MIQRIQTLYLLIVTALMAVTLFAPLAWFAGDAGEFGLYAFALKTAEGEAVQPAVYMGALLALACALPLVTIFLFRRRMLQIRLCVVEIVLLLGCVAMEGVYYFLSWRVFSDLAFHTQGFKPAIALAAGLPVVRISGGPGHFPRRIAGARGRQNPLICPHPTGPGVCRKVRSGSFYPRRMRRAEKNEIKWTDMVIKRMLQTLQVRK